MARISRSTTGVLYNLRIGTGTAETRIGTEGWVGQSYVVGQTDSIHFSRIVNAVIGDHSDRFGYRWLLYPVTGPAHSG